MSSLKHITLYILPFCRVCSVSNTEWSANYLPFRSTWDRSGFLVKLLFVIVTNYIFWPLCCLLFFDIRIMINPLVSSNFFDIISYLLWCPLRFLRFNLNFIFSFTLICLVGVRVLSILFVITRREEMYIGCVKLILKSLMFIITRCCTLRRAKNTPTRSFLCRTVNRK